MTLLMAIRHGQPVQVGIERGGEDVEFAEEADSDGKTKQ